MAVSRKTFTQGQKIRIPFSDKLWQVERQVGEWLKIEGLDSPIHIDKAVSVTEPFFYIKKTLKEAEDFRQLVNGIPEQLKMSLPVAVEWHGDNSIEEEQVFDLLEVMCGLSDDIEECGDYLIDADTFPYMDLDNLPPVSVKGIISFFQQVMSAADTSGEEDAIFFVIKDEESKSHFIIFELFLTPEFAALCIHTQASTVDTLD